MEKKKTKLTLSVNTKKSIENIELAKTVNKNSIVIEKKPHKSSNRSSFSRTAGAKPTGKSTRFKTSGPSKSRYSINPKTTTPITNDYERRKLAEQRATRRLKGDTAPKDLKGKTGLKKRELKLTVSRALSDKIETRARSLASLKRAKLKENRILTKEELKENLKPIKRDIDIPEAITVRELANRMAEQSSKVIKYLLEMGVTVTINQTLAADTA